MQELWEANKVEQILTASQVADLLQVHLRTVYKLARKGLIPGRKFGGGWRVSKEEILKIITSGRRASLQSDLSQAGAAFKYLRLVAPAPPRLRAASIYTAADA